MKNSFVRMGSQDEQFCLKWNDFQQCIKSTFQDLRDESDFMDVTLSCEGEQIKAHKVILSACSITFKNLLKKNPSQNPVILLWDVSPRDISAILDFMYNGEVNVKQEHLNSFLSVAEKLRVRGLCQSDSGKPSPKDNKAKSRPSESPADAGHQPAAKRQKYTDDNDIQEIAPSVKQEKLDAAAAPSAAVSGGGAAAGFGAVVEAPQPMMVVKDYPVEYTEAEDYGEYYEDDTSYGVDPVDQSQTGKDLYCPHCYKGFSRKDNLRNHIRDIHENAGKVFVCPICSKFSKSESALRMHHNIYHKTMMLK